MIFVHRSIAKTFNEALVRKVESLKCGMPWEPNVQLTPLPDTAKPAYLTDLIKDAISLGAVLANPEHGGKVEGTLFHPAVLTDVPLTAKIAIEEQFGPVIPVHTYDDLSEVEQYIVESQYGAQVSIFGHDPEVVGPLVDRLVNQVCRINLNTQCQRGPDVFPFTGRKSSAEGTLSVHDALRSFSIRSMVATKQDSVGKTVVRGILDKDSSRFLTTNFLL
jgi:glyceraldehyde-3-phosphate dehydrogenase (NADP+)